MKAACTAVALGLLALATPAAAEVVETRADGFRLRSVAVLETLTREEAWAALSQWGAWWSSAHTYSGDAGNLSLTLEAGGCLCEVWPGGQIEHGRVLLAWSERGLLRMNAPFGPLQAQPVTAILTYQISERDEGGVQVVQTLAVGGGDVGGLSEGVDAVMSEGLARFERFAETGSAD